MVIRKLTALINSNDNDNGLIVGNWSGEVADGTSPVTWTNSLDIFKTYLKTGKSVRYGQCWVFAALLASCRAVTNFESGHDGNADVIIEVSMNEDERSRDSIW